MASEKEEQEREREIGNGSNRLVTVHRFHDGIHRVQYTLHRATVHT